MDASDGCAGPTSRGTILQQCKNNYFNLNCNGSVMCRHTIFQEDTTLKYFLPIVVATMLCSACSSMPDQTYVAQRGYLNVAQVSDSSQIANLGSSEQTVIVDRPPKSVDQKSWTRIDDNSEAPIPVSLGTRSALPPVEHAPPLVSTPPVKNSKRKVKATKPLRKFHARHKSVICAPEKNGGNNHG